ncbi:Sterol O-acyltransferase 2 (Sterol-ester synthase 2) [Elasticomyces elasticus]|nr:Sterol O-acyltransferase 2 (Sterol-ester synthase 2) [Elasticomyces elasticus]
MTSVQLPSRPVELNDLDQVDHYLLTAEDAKLLQETLGHSQSQQKRSFRFQEHEIARKANTFKSLESESTQFHGFFVLFWLGVALMLLKVAANNWRIYGRIQGKNEIVRLMLDKDVLVLGLTDLALCWSTVFCLLLQRGMLKGYLRWDGFGWVIQNAKAPERGHNSSAHDWNADITDSKKSDVRQRSSSLQKFSESQETDQILSLIETIDKSVPLEPNQVSSFRELIEQEIEVLTEGLKGRCSQTNNHYPRNLTIRNFSDFISLPTLVYELEYARTKSINWLYVAEKTAATFGIIVVMIAVSQSWIYPVVVHTMQMKEEGLTVQQRLQEFPWVLSDLLFPFMMEYLLAFYVIWECVTETSTQTGGIQSHGINSPETGTDPSTTSSSAMYTTAPSVHTVSPASQPA